MLNLFVLAHKKDWPEVIPNVEVITARDYLLNESYYTKKSARVYNLCRSYRYQSLGYYVSLLAEARGHRCLPNISTIEDFKSSFTFRNFNEEFDKLIQKSLHHIKSSEFELSVYFGKNVSKRYERLSGLLYNAFRCPLIKVEFRFIKEKWYIKNVYPMAYKDIPEGHKDILLKSALDYFSRSEPKIKRKQHTRYDLAILINPDDSSSPSNQKALEKFEKAALKQGIGVEFITKADYSKIPMFDALFIRETTAVNHHTFRFSRRAEMEGLVVLDDSQSILKCSNKVFLFEMMKANHIKHPRTWILHEDNVEQLLSDKHLSFPCVLKRPDGAFSLGVKKVHSNEEFRSLAREELQSSDLILVQEFIPTDFDWRVGILNQEVLFVCKYYMVKGHWQVVKNHFSSQSVLKKSEGHTDTYLLSQVPPALLKTALMATKLIGKGLYGVDIKEVKGEFYIIEINDNPNIDCGIEDFCLKNELYDRIIGYFKERIELGRKDDIRK
jgi:glutathione synthase/RimK-type ligase-like ATP-grasp enzyme